MMSVYRKRCVIFNSRPIPSAFGCFAPRPTPGLRHWTPLGDFRPRLLSLQKFLRAPMSSTSILSVCQRWYIGTYLRKTGEMHRDKCLDHPLASGGSTFKEGNCTPQLLHPRIFGFAPPVWHDATKNCQYEYYNITSLCRSNA